MRHKGNYTLFLLASCLYLSLFFVVYLLFFGLMGIHNPQILNFSRTAAITLASFTFMLIVMQSVYGKIDLTHTSRGMNCLSIILSVAFTDIFTYTLLQIMNVNPYNNARLILFGKDFPLLIVCIVLQSIWSYGTILIADRIFHQLFPPVKACLITTSQDDANDIFKKFYKYSNAYSIDSVVHFEHEHVKDYIQNAETVILYNVPTEKQNLIVAQCYEKSINALIFPSIHDLIVSSTERVVFDDKPFLLANFSSISLFQRLLKRSFDLCGSIILLTLLSPLFLFCAIWIKLSDRGSVFFIQERETLHGKIFNIIKFRTMYENIDQQRGVVSSAKDNDDRITKPGKWLRKFRLDELPQLINILKGDMSFVGPRPEMLKNAYAYAEQYPQFKYRLKMKAGLTGLAQIDGKYNTTFEDKLLLDLFYIENFSIKLDIKLLFRTFIIFFKKDSTEGFNRNHGYNAPTIIKN